MTPASGTAGTDLTALARDIDACCRLHGYFRRGPAPVSTV